MFDSAFGKKPPETGGSLGWEPRSPLAKNKTKDRPAFYAKVFRWTMPDGQTTAPHSVEIAGSFSSWEKIPLSREGAMNSWQVTLPQIPAHHTHHYMLFVDGKPTQDKNCDGLALANGPQEEQYTIATARGPRVFMLFAQTK